MTRTEIIQAVLRRAKDALAAGIIDPPDDSENYAGSRQWIQSFIYDGIGWHDDARRYRHDGQFSWCGAFAAWCYEPFVPLAVRKQTFPSTYRLDRDWGTTTRRLTFPKRPAPGDILVVGHEREYGNHITLVTECLPGGAPWYVTTIEGNGFGDGPASTKKYEGVITRTRTEREMAAVYRLLDADLGLEAVA